MLQAPEHEIRIETLKLLLIRQYYSLDCTMGQLFSVDYRSGVSNHICWTLEDASSAHKVYGETCIPVGQYKVILSHSPKFKKVLPELLEVPNYAGVRIHGGNSVKDTLGCILVGKYKEERTERIWSCAEPLNSIIDAIGQYEHCVLEVI